jgi:sterol desaturase/sphingolipid hydroxylase (fatty acid hydroxylase superfamily)
MDWIESMFSSVQQVLFEAVVRPLLFGAGLGNLLEDGYQATGWLLVGLVQLVLMVIVIAPLQRWRPVEPVTDRRAVRIDMLYTLIHRLGLFRLVLFFAVTPGFNQLFAWLHGQGVGTLQLDAIWPGVTDLPWVSLLLYLLAIDLADYWIHRGQHSIQAWWALHALHHSQRQMTMWSDNRNHLLDDLVRDSLLVLLAQAIGVAPGQFIAIVAVTQLSENLQHANVRLSFGRWGERLWVSPRFHRRHHAIGIGHETVLQGPGGASHTVLGGCNFGVLLPWWDLLFGTANFDNRYDPTGIRDQAEAGRDYGRGFWSQQWLGLKRLAGKA